MALEGFPEVGLVYHSFFDQFGFTNDFLIPYNSQIDYSQSGGVTPKLLILLYINLISIFPSSLSLVYTLGILIRQFWLCKFVKAPVRFILDLTSG